MKLRIYSIFDKSAGTYTAPLFLRDDTQAKRSFIEAVNTPSSTYNKFADSFALYCVGVWDDEGCTFQLHEPLFMCDAAACLREQPRQLDLKELEGKN